MLGVGTPGLLAVHSVSKTYNLAGLRVGFYAGDADLVHYLSEVRKHAGFMVPGPAQHAAAVALAQDDAVEAQRAVYRRRLERTAAILREETAKGAFPAVLHCFTGGAALARAGLDLGLYVSFSGIVTFKKSEALRDVAQSVPLDRLLVETDAPYLAPGKYRGKRNEPAYVVETAKILADTRGVSFDELARQTTDNFFRLFSKVPRPAVATPA